MSSISGNYNDMIMAMDGATSDNKGQDPNPLGYLTMLPGELRNAIYREVLLDEEDIVVTKTNIHKRTDLLRVSSAIQQEATSIFIGENTFVNPAEGKIKCVNSLIDFLSASCRSARPSKLKRQARKSRLYTATETAIYHAFNRISQFGIRNYFAGSAFLAAVQAMGRQENNQTSPVEEVTVTDNTIVAKKPKATASCELKPEMPNYRAAVFFYQQIGVFIKIVDVYNRSSHQVATIDTPNCSVQ